jgi:hypothetical protein
MVNTYCLVNPYIKGDINTKIKSQNSHEAATTFYTKLSEHFNNSIPKFIFTIQKGSSGEGKFYHYIVNENKNNEEVNYSIKLLKDDSNFKLDNFKLKLEEIKTKFDQAGGQSSEDENERKHKSKKHKSKKHNKKSNKYDDDSDDSSDDSDSSESDEHFYKIAKKYVHNKTRQPIYYLSLIHI